MRLTTLLFLTAVTAVTWVVSLFHISAQPPPPAKSLKPSTTTQPALLIAKENHGINELLLFGTPYERGLAEAKLLPEVLQAEERILFGEFERIFTNPFVRFGIMIGVMRWFWGAEKFFSDGAKAQFYGISQAASPEFDHYVDGYTRQAVFHGIHEVGQFFVDIRREDFGCTAVAVPKTDGFVIGRNFDFEVGRLFDTEKTVKWHFPTTGIPFVSVSWPGFAGVVTGVNQRGVYISLNAAGSQDFRRYGSLTSLLAAQALQFKKTARAAAQFIATSQVFVTDIFLIADQHEAFRVEKSPRKAAIVPITTPHVVANHLTHHKFAGDAVNDWRKKNLTTVFRHQRAKELLARLKADVSDRDLYFEIQEILRDKLGLNDEQLHPGNRRAIDALVTSHSVIYDSQHQKLFVSKGPALTGAYLGWDLKQSFDQQTPIRTKPLPPDPVLSPRDFARIKSSLKLVAKAADQIAAGDCQDAGRSLELASRLAEDHNYYYRVKGMWHECRNEQQQAKESWRQALRLQPAYAQDREYLRRRI